MGVHCDRHETEAVQDACASPPATWSKSPLLPENGAHGWPREPDTHHNDKDDRASETPDERFMDGDPAEVRVPIALRVQPNRKAFGEGRG